MHKLLLLLISLGVILGALGFLGNLGKKTNPLPKALVEQPAIFNVVVVLDFGQEKKEASVAATSNTTVFKALETVVNKNNLELKTKQYDFGVFVEGIGGVENTKDRSWIYFVNAKSVEVAADKYNLKNGDKVEWKYIKPNF